MNTNGTPGRGGRSRSNRSLVSLVVVVSALGIAAAALGVPPKKGGVYEGTLFATSGVALQKKVRLVVAKSGTNARVIWWCGTGRSPSTLRIQVAVDGTFKGTSNVGSLTVWAIKGRFVSPSKARAALQLKATCDGKGGTANLELQP